MISLTYVCRRLLSGVLFMIAVAGVFFESQEHHRAPDVH